MGADRNKPSDGIVEEAAEWVVLLDDPGASLEQRRAFVRWLKRSPEHLCEYLRAEQVWAELAGADTARRLDVDELLARTQTDTVVELGAVAGTPAPAPASRRRSTRIGVRATAAAAAVAVLALAGAFWMLLSPAHDYATAVGEQRKIRLADGSSVVLNTGTRLHVDYSDGAREVRLLEGEALFSVQKDAARPFRVLSDRAVVQAVGTSFLVHRKPGRTVVTVLQGEVAIARSERAGEFSAAHIPAEALRVEGGARVDVALSGIRTRNLPNPAAAAAWREGRLIFEGDTLADVVAEFNRYNEVKLVLEGAHLSGERVSGVFDSDRPQALARFLEHAGVVEPAVETDERILLVQRR